MTETTHEKKLSRFLQQIIALFFLITLITLTSLIQSLVSPKFQATTKQQDAYWLVLHRKTNKEFLYKGVPGDQKKSKLIKTFVVKSGIPNQRPTPLPQLVGKEYWVITQKHEETENPETAPYFLTLNIPVSETEPFGPTPYEECNGQCNWVLPGAFGLHGSGGDVTKLAAENPGSSGCIRHFDEDIAYLYNLLEPQKEEVRYYIQNI